MLHHTGRGITIVGVEQYKDILLHIYLLKTQRVEDGHLAMCVIKYIFMNKYNPQYIKDILFCLRKAKTNAFLNQGDCISFRNIVEICRIIDVTMLPMFYIWEHYFHRDLSEINMEEHLRKPYEKFSRNPLTNTWAFYLLLKTSVYDIIPTRIKKKLLVIYEPLINI